MSSSHGSAPTTGHIDTPHLRLTWSEAPWDTAVFGRPVIQITAMEIRGPDALRDFRSFEAAREAADAALVSCRLDHAALRESMLLEERGFRFIEMLYQPFLEPLPETTADISNRLEAGRAEAEEVETIAEIAGTVFRHERFHVDPRLDPALGDRRYRNWVRSSFDHPRQRLYSVRDQGRVVAFFVTEMLDDDCCYWHLNGVSAHCQGQGYGRRAWLTMLGLAREQGATRVQTAIVARNNRVLNLYARLGFRFPPPLMTLHWVG
ncbi:MAG TPA: GNAT family N-acetyltransferase [Sedimenticola sp.]|nr:GNAT family N-acetyltransferase [Sedimenticola sp.]